MAILLMRASGGKASEGQRGRSGKGSLSPEVPVTAAQCLLGCDHVVSHNQPRCPDDPHLPASTG
jgi:hypothetical protein